MTKQEAIEHLDIISKFISYDKESTIIANIQEALKIAIEALEQQDICYCKDCKIRNKDGYCMRQMTVNLITMVKDTDFCSWGEKKGDNKNGTTQI